MTQQSRQDQVKMLPVDQELKKFIESGGRPAAKSYFDEVLQHAATTSAQVIGQTYERTAINNDVKEHTH